jgi:hypothetical protein
MMAGLHGCLRERGERRAEAWRVHGGYAVEADRPQHANVGGAEGVGEAMPRLREREHERHEKERDGEQAYHLLLPSRSGCQPLPHARLSAR